jgi:hypothetical protein
MRILPRRSLISLAALAAYLAVYVFAAALHHHGPESLPGKQPAASNVSGQFQESDQAASHEDSDCPLCSVLRLAQIPQIACDLTEAPAPAFNEPSSEALIRPYPLAPLTHSRAPPLL